MIKKIYICDKCGKEESEDCFYGAYDINGTVVCGECRLIRTKEEIRDASCRGIA